MNITELDSYNLDDAVKFNDHLNPKLWDANEHLRPEVRNQLLRIADDFREFLGVTDIDLEDITISGSNAAYTYTPNSDIDLHLVVKMPNDEVYHELFDAKKFQYNEQHNIKIGGYDVELYVQDAAEPHISQGIYSVLNNDWIQVPRRVKSVVDDTSTENKFKTVGLQIERAIKSGNLKRMDRLAQKIKRMRQTGLEQHGEFGPENLAFKMLRSQGKIKELYDARNRAKDQELSLRERRQPHSVFTYGFKHEESRQPEIVEAEPVTVPSDEEILKDFIDFCFKELKLKQMPTIKLRRDPQWSVRNKTFGRYINDQHLLEVAWGHRHIMDVLRTVAHELTHKHQHERDGSRMGPDAGETGSPYENEANARAGILMRDYARLHPNYFAVGQAHGLHADEVTESASGYIPTKKQARDPRFSMALTQDIRPGQLGKEANKLKLRTDSQGHPQTANPNGLFEKLALELSQFKTVTESTEQLDEVRMAPSNLMQWARSPAAEGVRAGFEAELIFRDARSDSGDDYEMEPDYDMDERCRSIQGIIEFFTNGDYGYMSQSQQRDLEEKLDQQYYEWQEDQMYRAWEDERDDLIRDAWLNEKPMAERIHAALVDGMELTDAQADAVVALQEKRAKKELTGPELTDEQLEMARQYSEARSIADDILDEDVEQTIAKEDGFYDEVLDDFRSDFYVDDDSNFFNDIGLDTMRDVANAYDLDWPYLIGSGGSGSRDPEEIADSLSDVLGTRVKFSGSWHSGATGADRDYRYWYVEGDGSLKPDDSDDAGLEVISPPMPLLTTLEKLQELTDWANSAEGNAYTNKSTGLHMGISVPYKGGDIDYVKLILFMGDEYVLKSFGREASTYCESAMQKFRRNLKSGRADPMGVIKYMQNGLLELAHKDIQKGVGSEKFTSAHIQDGYIEFRSPGNDWLAEESADPEKLSSTMLRFARAMSIAANPAEERREYAKKLYKLVAPEGDNQLALFAQYNAGELDKEQLKKRWAEKTLEKEKPQGDETEWEAYDSTTGKILGTTKNFSRTNAVNYFRDTMKLDSFQVREREPEAKTPRAKLAKRIAEPRQKADWDVVYKPTGRVIDNILRVDREQAEKLLAKVAVLHDFANADDLEIRPQDVKQAKDNAQDSADLRANLTGTESPFREPQDATEVPRDWEYVDRITGRVVDTVSGASYNQANTVQADIERRYPAADIYLRSVSPRPELEENFAEGLSQNQGQVRQTLNAWMNQDQQYTDPTQRAGFQAKVWPYIQKNINSILSDKGADGKGSYPAAPYAAWLLVQHMDAYPQNQGKFASQLEQAGLDPTDGKDGEGKLQFLKDRYKVNKWIAANANNKEYFINNEPLPNPTVNVRNPAMFKDAGKPWTSAKDALKGAINAGNKLLVAAVQATNAQTQPSYKQTTNENFADGKGPGRAGDSVRHGIPKHATIAELEKASHAKGRKGQLARWQLNMRRGKKKHAS
jgi:Putative amidoligase enzyme